MADRVFFATRNQTNTPSGFVGMAGVWRELVAWDGSSLDGDGYATSSGGEYVYGDKTRIPYALPLATGVQQSFGVKKVTLDITGAFKVRNTISPDEAEVANTSDELEAQISGSTVTRERDLCFGSPYWQNGGSYLHFNFGTNCAAAVSINFGFSPENNEFALTSDEHVGAHLVLRFWAFITGYPGLVFTNEPKMNLAAPTTAFTAEIMGQTVQLYNQNDIATPAGWEITFPDSVELSASEYWPYANSLGNPVYNTATGAQLVDPLS